MMRITFARFEVLGQCCRRFKPSWKRSFVVAFVISDVLKGFSAFKISVTTRPMTASYLRRFECSE
jgi:hypothetical protein